MRHINNIEGKLFSSMLKDTTQVVDQCRTPVDENRGECTRISDNLCEAYMNPEGKWKMGHCPLATHITLEIEEHKGKKRVGQQKQKRRRRNK